MVGSCGEETTIAQVYCTGIWRWRADNSLVSQRVNVYYGWSTIPVSERQNVDMHKTTLSFLREIKRRKTSQNEKNEKSMRLLYADSFASAAGDR